MALPRPRLADLPLLLGATVCFLLTGAGQLFASPAASGHGDPVAPVVLALAGILVLAKLAGELATRLNQPAVLGELLLGVVLGNLVHLGVPWFEAMKSDSTLDLLARIGVLLLLFQAGLESTVAQMLKVGLSAFLVATIGVTLPFVLGYGVGVWLLPDASGYVHAFLGTALCATSVGITARVLGDLGKTQTPEARIVLGAAVIDDVMGLVILALVAGVIGAADTGVALSLLDVAWTVGKAVGFLLLALVAGYWLSPRLFHVASKLQARGALITFGLATCFALSWGADAIGLAPLVGAFAAGLVLEDVHFVDFKQRGEATLEHLVEPIASVFVPLFFVLMGLKTDLAAFFAAGVPLLALALTVAAIVGKLLCGLGTVTRGVNRLTVGIGMIPRGEVGLIFANLGLSLQLGGKPVLDSAAFSALIVMVILTTLVTPPLLRWNFASPSRAAVASSR